MSGEHVAGYCPMGCGKTLFLGAMGYVTCSYLQCPNPTALSNIITDAETEHRVTFSKTKFTITHPLRERLTDMAKCALHDYLDRLGGPPVKTGRYRATAHGTGWRFDAQNTANSPTPTERGGE